MYDFQTIKLLHRHGGDDFAPMVQGDHDPSSHDPERAWLKGARIFSCTRCDDHVVMLPAEEPPSGGPGQDAP